MIRAMLAGCLFWRANSLSEWGQDEGRSPPGLPPEPPGGEGGAWGSAPQGGRDGQPGLVEAGQPGTTGGILRHSAALRGTWLPAARHSPAFNGIPRHTPRLDDIERHSATLNGIARHIAPFRPLCDTQCRGRKWNGKARCVSYQYKLTLVLAATAPYSPAARRYLALRGQQPLPRP